MNVKSCIVVTSMIFMVHYVRGKVRSDILNTIIPLYTVKLKSVYTRDVHCALLSQGVVQAECFTWSTGRHSAVFKDRFKMFVRSFSTFSYILLYIRKG